MFWACTQKILAVVKMLKSFWWKEPFSVLLTVKIPQQILGLRTKLHLVYSLVLVIDSQRMNVLDQILMRITFGNLGIQDFKHSKQRTWIYESCSSDQICDSNMNFLKSTKGYSLALPLASAFRSFSDGSADLGTPFVQVQPWKWSQMCSALPGCGCSKILWCSKAGLVIFV